MSNRSISRAITFIELIIVVLIIAILTSLAIPQFKAAVDNFNLESFVKNIYYLSRYLQSSAISIGSLYYLSIDQEEGKIWAMYKTEGEFKPVEGRFGNVYKLPEGVTMSTKKTNLEAEAGIYFYPDGSIDEITINFENSHQHKLSLSIRGAAGDIKIK